jgi:retinol dehydrogenase-12
MTLQLAGKICLVTGATSGIGLETARGLAERGAHLVLVGRDSERTRRIAESIGVPGRTDFLVADLLSLAEVQGLAAAFKVRYDRLDLLINNAGGLFTERKLTAEGFEQTWALNHLSYFVLTLELSDLIKASAPARIVNVASRAHSRAKLDFSDLQGERSFGGMKQYERSKLANVMFTAALARRLKLDGVTANSLHPGVVATGFGADARGPIKFALKLFRPLFISPAAGAATSIYLAASPDVEGLSGRYFAQSREVAPSAVSQDIDMQEELWRVSLEQTVRFRSRSL